MFNSPQSEIDWEDLVDNISEGDLIPIIGNELFKFKKDNRLVLLDDFISQKLLEENNLNFVEGISLAATVAYLEKEKNLSINKIIRRLKEIVDEIDFDFPLLEPLLKIKPILFYTHTTLYSSLLVKEIEKYKKKEVELIDFSIRSKFNDCKDIEKLTAPLVFNVFGSFRSPDPALREEEMLEFTTSFKERMMDNANNILDALKNKTLLFLGCSYPDWLIRFFLRVLSNERVNDWLNRRSKIIVVNDQPNDWQKQYEFFKSFKAITYNGDTSDFINELQLNWKKVNHETVKPKMVFLSYTQQDTPAVENLKNAISAIENVTCWYDKEKLFGGDNFEYNIISNIREADLFIPLLSENSLMHVDKYVQDEWAKADAISKIRELDGVKEKYLLPIVIDNSDLNNNIVKKYYAQLSIEKVPGGKANEAFINRLKNILNPS